MLDKPVWAGSVVLGEMVLGEAELVHGGAGVLALVPSVEGQIETLCMGCSCSARGLSITIITIITIHSPSLYPLAPSVFCLVTALEGISDRTEEEEQGWAEGTWSSILGQEVF